MCGLRARTTLPPGTTAQLRGLLRERLHGRSCWPMPVQYAEIALRRRLGVTALDAVRRLAVIALDAVRRLGVIELDALRRLAVIALDAVRRLGVIELDALRRLRVIELDALRWLAVSEDAHLRYVRTPPAPLRRCANVPEVCVLRFGTDASPRHPRGGAVTVEAHHREGHGDALSRAGITRALAFALPSKPTTEGGTTTLSRGGITPGRLRVTARAQL